MKRTILAVIFCLLCLSASGQRHMTFKGLPIEGSASKFSSRLVQRGFQLSSDYELEHDMKEFKGPFAGKKGCTCVLTSGKDGQLVRLCVLLPKTTSWDEAQSDYRNQVDLYSKKYGHPTQIVEDFASPFYDGCGKEYEAVIGGHVRYMTNFTHRDGTIIVSIQYVESSICVLIDYRTTYMVDLPSISYLL